MAHIHKKGPLPALFKLWSKNPYHVKNCLSSLLYVDRLSDVTMLQFLKFLVHHEWLANLTQKCSSALAMMRPCEPYSTSDHAFMWLNSSSQSPWPCATRAIWKIRVLQKMTTWVNTAIQMPLVHCAGLLYESGMLHDVLSGNITHAWEIVLSISQR